MTSVNSYKDSLDVTLKQYENAYLTPLSKFKFEGTLPKDVVQLLRLEKDITSKLNEIRSVSIPAVSFDATSSVKTYYDKLDEASRTARHNIMTKAENERQQRIKAHEQNIVDVKNYNNSLTDPYREKHKELLECKEELQYVFDYYDISPMDMSISDDITEDEFNTLIDESINVCKKYQKKNVPLFDKIVNPLKDETNIQFTLSYVALILVVLYFALPFVAIPCFVIVFKSVHGLYKDLEKLKIAYVLMSEVDYNRFVKDDAFKQVEELQLDDIETKKDEELSKVKDYSEERVKAMKALEAENVEIVKRCNEVTSKVKKAYADVISDLEKTLKDIKDSIDRLMKNYKPFPTVQNNSVVMSHTYTLGRIEGKLDVKGTLPLNNIVFNSSDRTTAINNVKLYLANALLSVRVKQLTVEIFDPKNMCGEFTEFFTPETKPYIKPNNMTLDKLMETYKKYSQDNIIVLDNKDIDTFNKSE